MEELIEEITPIIELISEQEVINVDESDINSLLGIDDSIPKENEKSNIKKKEDDILVKFPILIPDQEERLSRFSGSLWFSEIQKMTITLAGLGGIGSYIAFLLSRINPEKIILFDGDNVELVNLAGQFYSKNQIGSRKTTASINNMFNFSTYRNYIAKNYFTEESESSNIMICGFDNMKARKLYFNSWLKHVKSLTENNRELCLFIDGRLNAEEYQILTIIGTDEYNIKKYQDEFLFNDNEAQATTCSFKQTSYTAMHIGSTMTNILINFVSNLCGDCRSVPFFIEYDASMLHFKIID